MDIDEFLKKSAPKGSSGAATLPASKSISSIDDYFAAAKPPKGYVPPEIVATPPEKVPEKKPRRGVAERIDSLTARPEPGSAREQTMRGQLPSSIAENLPFGIGEIIRTTRDEPELFGQVTFEDVLKGIVDTSKGVFSGLAKVGSSLAMVPLKFNLPVLGEVTNLEYDAAHRVAQGESVNKVILEEGVINNIFGVLMLAGLAGEVAGPRPVTVAKTQFKGQTPGGLKVKEQPRSFRHYQEPTATEALAPEVVSKLGVNLGPKYNPELPTYFRVTGRANGLIRGEVVQVKPSYLETFLNKFGANASKVPENMLVPLATRDLNQKSLEGTKVDIVDSNAVTKMPKEVATEKVNNMIPALKATTDEHLVTTAREVAKQSGDTALMAKVEEAIKAGEKSVEKVDNIEATLDETLENNKITPESQLTNPAGEPYRPARVQPAERIYSNEVTSKFTTGEYKGKPYTTDSYILEFNSDVTKAPKKAQIIGKEEAPTEEAIDRLMPNMEEASKVTVGKAYSSNGTEFVELGSEDVDVVVQRKYYDYFNKKYPGVRFMAVTNRSPIVAMKGENPVGLIMPVNPSAVAKKEMIWEKPKVAQEKLKNPPEKTTAKKTTPAKKPTVEKSPALNDGELGSLASPQGNKTIRKIIEKQSAAKVDDVQEPPAGFKISERAKAILEEFGVPVGEKTLSSRLLGVYKPLTQKVRVQALYDVTTVTHEAVHAIDDQIKFSEKLIANTGNGAKIRNRLTDIYEDIYPNAKRTHKLDKRIKEGLAVFFENYFYDPASISAKYPDLVDAFIKPGGEYYDPQFSKLIDKMNELVDDYARLSPEERIGSRIRTGKEVVDRQTGFSWKQRVEYELFNRFEPLKRYSKDAGVSGTWDDPLVQAFNILNKNSIITNWVKGKNTPVLLRDGNFRIDQGSVADYLKLVKGNENQFRSYLVARRVVADNNTLTALKNLPEEMQLPVKERMQKLEETIKRDDFSLQDASAVVEKFGEQFADAEVIYDNINKRMIDMAEESDLINAETADTYRNEVGYASFRRYIDEELQSVGTIQSSSKSKVTSFKERTGSQLDIVDPVYSQIMAINEVIGKGMENRLWVKVADLAKKAPEISQRFERIETKTAVDGEGNVSFPQEKDPGIVRVFRGGKREFYKVAPEFGAVAKQLRGKEMDAFVQFLRIPSSLFTRLTTSANPLFAAGNLSVDQFSALAQTKTGFKPIVDPIKSFYDYVTGDAGVQAYVAMGGKRQTLSALYDLSPEDVAHKLTGGETKMEKVSRVVDAGLGILELPANTSEIMTRYSEYRKSVEKGMPMSVAMYNASEVTTPFQLQGNMGGRFGQEAIKSIPYLNAIVQVLYKYGRATKDNPKRMGSVTAGLFAAGLTAAILTYKSASEKQKRLLSEQPVRNSSKYIYIPSPNGEDLIKLRIPEQMGVFLGMAQLFVAENYGHSKATFDEYVDVISSAIPEQVQFWNPGKAVISWIPQTLKPSVQTAFNKKTFPDLGPIVSEYMRLKKPEEQYNVYTSESAKAIGRLLNISPALTEFWIKNQFGVVGGLFVGKTPGSPLHVQEKEYVMTGRAYNRFYDNRDLVNQQYEEQVKNHPDKYSYQEKYETSQARSMYTSVSELLTAMRDIDKNAELPDPIKTAAYDLLLKIDSTKNIDDIRPSMLLLRDELYKFKHTQ